MTDDSSGGALLAGTADGVYRVVGVSASTPTTVRRTLDVPRAERVCRFDGIPGVFAATKAGLYYSRSGTVWRDLGVPIEPVYAVTVSPSGEWLYAGTRPTRVYGAPMEFDGAVLRVDSSSWTECEGFRALPSREKWGVERHDNVAQVRSLRVHPDRPGRIVAGVEPGGVHVSDDGGVTWIERNEGVHDDVHQLCVLGAGEYVEATGVGLYLTSDAGRSWRRLDDGVDQRYFRACFIHDGDLYASGACTSPDEWESDRADPRLFELRADGTLEVVPLPVADAVIVGWATLDEGLVAVTHRGTLLRRRDERWTVVGAFSTPDSLYGRYIDLTSWQH